MTKLDQARNPATPAASNSLHDFTDKARAIIAQMYRERGEPVRADAVMSGHVAYRDTIDAVVYALRSAK